ncbi:hypothetical protein D3C76_1109420 [compost metagenome]
MIAASKKGAVHTGLRADIGHQDVTQVQGCQVLPVKFMLTPIRLPEDFIGRGDLVHRPVDEGANCKIVFAVRGFAWQQGAEHRGVDNQPRPLARRVAQYQGDEGGIELLSKGFEKARPGNRLARPLVDAFEKSAQPGRVERCSMVVRFADHAVQDSL